MLFLGAGASKPFGLPDLHELTELIRTRLPNDPFKEIERILNRNDNLITFSKEELDVEIFMSVLGGLQDPQNSIKELGPFGIYLYKLLENKGLIENIKMSAEQIKELKKESLKQISTLLKNPNSQDAEKLYDQLFSLEKSVNEKKNAVGTRVYNIFDHVATTNYDLALERYATKRKGDLSMYVINRGFQPISNEEAKYLDLAFLRNSSKSVNYLKLHGSLDWWEREDKKIVLSASDIPSYGGDFVDRIMIYPVYEKYISREPFFSLYVAFRRILDDEKIIIVIGYSFRDDAINNAFLETLSIDKESRMIICTKSPEVKQRISNKYKEYVTRVSLIDKHFGEEGFISELTSRLENEKIGM